MVILPGKTPPSSISVISAKCNILSFASFSLDLSKKSTVVNIQLISKITKYFFPLHDDLKNWIMADCLEICWNDFIVFSFFLVKYIIFSDQLFKKTHLLERMKLRERMTKSIFGKGLFNLLKFAKHFWIFICYRKLNFTQL